MSQNMFTDFSRNLSSAGYFLSNFNRIIRTSGDAFYYFNDGGNGIANLLFGGVDLGNACQRAVRDRKG